MVEAREQTRRRRGNLLGVRILILLSIIQVPPQSKFPALSQERSKQMAQIQWGPTIEGLTLSIAVAMPQYKVKEPIVLEVALKNVSTTPVQIVSRSVWYDYNFKVQRADGVEVQKTAYAVK